MPNHCAMVTLDSVLVCLRWFLSSFLTPLVNLVSKCTFCMYMGPLSLAGVLVDRTCRVAWDAGTGAGMLGCGGWRRGQFVAVGPLLRFD